MLADAGDLVHTSLDTSDYVFVAIAAAILANVLFFQLSRNVPLKRRVWPIWLVGSGIGLVAGGWALGGFPLAVLFLVGAVASVRFGKKAMHFCDNCGRTVWGPMFGPTRYCPSCGAVLHRSEPGSHAA